MAATGRHSILGFVFGYDKVPAPRPHPFRPLRFEDVPPDAVRALGRVVGEFAPERLLVIPADPAPEASRATDPRAKVLAIDSNGVAIWIAGGTDSADGAVESIPVSRLLAIDDRHVLLNGHVAFHADEACLDVGYNVVARREFRESLLVLRRAMAPPPQPVDDRFVWLDRDGHPGTASGLPHKWMVALSEGDLRLDRLLPAAIAVGAVSPSLSARGHAPSGVAILGPRELIVASEPGHRLPIARYGVDLLTVPRDRLTAIRWDGRTLGVGVGRAGIPSRWLERQVEPRLVEAMRAAFGDHVAWN